MDRLKAASGRRPARRDEDEEDEKPQRRGRDADEDEEKPQRRGRDNDDDERPQRGRGKREEADDEDTGARGGRKPREVELEDAGSKPAAKAGRGKAGGGLSAAISEHMKQYDEIKDGLVKIRSNTALIDKLKEKEQKAVNEKERKENMAELDRIMSETSNMATKIKNSLDKIKAENDQYAANKENQNSATNQMRINMYQTHIRRFHQEMNAYNQAAQDFKTTLKDRTRRQLPILIKDITPEKVEEIVESGQADKVISQALISEDLDNVIAQIEERHQGIAKLERQVLEVYELFRDLATLVDLQQETMDVISERIDRAKDYTADAEKELRSAQEHQRKARQRQCCILFIVVGILVGILAPVIATQVVKS